MIMLFYLIISAFAFAFFGIELIPERLQTPIGWLCMVVLFAIDLVVEAAVISIWYERRQK